LYLKEIKKIGDYRGTADQSFILPHLDYSPLIHKKRASFR